ncbi:MAG: hypothetical protein OEM62_02325 [Acidobacteriota bacterium]|nr:hypothetical protein [Acidobacteriota bacterium]
MSIQPGDLPLTRPDAACAFDFLFGRWRVHNRRLRERLVGSDDWEEFGASLEVRPILGGLGNVDQYRTMIDDSYFEGLSLRLFSLADETWRIYWADTTTGQLLPPLIGRFEGGVGTFYGHEKHLDARVRVRFLWQSLDSDSARWQQAYAADNGEKWEINWQMDLRRH